MLAVQNQLLFKMPWKSVFPIWMCMEKVPVIRLDSKCSEVFLVLSWHHFPVVLSFFHLKPGSHTTKWMFPCLPVLTQCHFGVLLSTSCLFLCFLSSHAHKTVGWADEMRSG